MRTTVNIDGDLLQAAKSLARARSVPLGYVISQLMRQGLQAGRQLTAHPTTHFPVFEVSADARPITAEDVKRAEDEP